MLLQTRILFSLSEVHPSCLSQGYYYLFGQDNVFNSGLAGEQRNLSQIKRQYKETPCGPPLHTQHQVACQQIGSQKFKRQLNRCTKPPRRGDIKQLNLLKGMMCHHLIVTYILSPTKEEHALTRVPGCQCARKIIKTPCCAMLPSCLRSDY
jgi:hypothetical protein